jgi:NAD(P)-dependent dehydrogenase (short-subunit alcohol dehydrogenase family)
MDLTKAVLVTGASTGIGRTITERLAAARCLVFAGARRDCDLRALAAIEHVQPLRLDVTRLSDIATAVDTIRTSGRILCGLVNNAGVATIGSILESDDAELELTIAVNVLGTYRVTRAFVPLVAAARGRIIMMSSISGILADRNLSAYSMSKHAVEAFTDSLAAELEPLGMRVSVIEPGNFRTEIASNAVKRIGRDPGLPDLSHCRPPDEVAAAVEMALFEAEPKRRYLVAPNEAEARITIRKQIEQLVELNEGHLHTYQRDMLVEMLDEALAAAAVSGRT